MKFDAKTQKPQSTVQPQADANWEDCIVEELSDEAAAAVSGGGYPNNTVNSPQEFWEAVWRGLGSGAGIG